MLVRVDDRRSISLSGYYFTLIKKRSRDLMEEQKAINSLAIIL